MLLNTQTVRRTTTLPKAKRSMASMLVAVTCALYLLVTIVLALLIWTLSDRWWPATVLLFAPRWTFATPLLLLVPIASVFHWRSLISLGLAGAVLAFPVLGYCYSLDGGSTEKDATSIRILSCNIHRQQLDAESFRQLIEATSPDVIALQDWSSKHEEVLFGDSAWHTQRDGELFIASRFPISRTTQVISPPTEQPGFKVRYGAAAAYQLLTPDGPITLVNLHLASPHEALQAMREGNSSFTEQLAFNTQQREIEAGTVADYIEAQNGPVVIVGDFNTPRESHVFRDHFGNLLNAFSAKGRGFGLTHVSMASSVRIDHVLVNQALNVRECWLADAAGSPHRPVVTDIATDQTATLKSVSTEP